MSTRPTTPRVVTPCGTRLKLGLHILANLCIPLSGFFSAAVVCCSSPHKSEYRSRHSELRSFVGDGASSDGPKKMHCFSAAQREVSEMDLHRREMKKCGSKDLNSRENLFGNEGVYIPRCPSSLRASSQVAFTYTKPKVISAS
jgi:hypothetical protein